MSGEASRGVGLRILIAATLLKVMLSAILFVAAFATLWTSLGPRHLLMFAHVLVFGGTGAFLLRAGRKNRRATLLGTAFLLTAAVFADNAPAAITASGMSIVAPLRWLLSLEVDAFTAYVLWAFVAEFPQVASFGPRHRVPRFGTRVALAVSIALFVISLLLSTFQLPAGLQTLLRPFARDVSASTPLYWAIQYAMALPALLVMVWKAAGAPASERRRARLLMGALVVGTGPTVLYVLASSLFPQLGVAVPISMAGWVIYPTLLATPLMTAYAVVVEDALDARILIRRAAQYALARYTLAAATSIPIMLLLLALYQRRARSIEDVLTGANGLLLLGLSALSAAAYRGRRAALEVLDRRFFREQYDSRRILGQLVTHCRRATTRAELAETLTNEIDRALHLETSFVFLRDQPGRPFVAPAGGMRELPADTRLPAELRDAEILEVDFERPSEALVAVTETDRRWLADAGARLVLPLRAVDREVVGLVVLGEKRSELAFSDEDRLLLTTVASAASLSLAHLSAHPQSRNADAPALPSPVTELPAVECEKCGHVYSAGTSVCTRCGGPTSSASIPDVLAGKFRVLERVGAGGMGVVYRGMDLQLQRFVAIKALPDMSPGQAARLRREARSMAAVAHPNLALIFGSESWNGMPLLIVEYLEGGTLDRRLSKGPMPTAQVLAMGVALSDAVAALHSAGMLHRDIKPSNIGFTLQGTAKLLDFGLARFLPGSSQIDRFRTEERAFFHGVGVASTAEHALSTTTEGRVPGTPLYLSPEALGGAEPDPSFDLWSLCVVMFEAICGSHPAQDSSPLKTLVRIATGSIRDLTEIIPDAHPDVANFFRHALALQPSERPSSAQSLREQLAGLLALTSDARLPA